MVVAAKHSFFMICLLSFIVVGCRQNEDEPTLVIPTSTSELQRNEPTDTPADVTTSSTTVSREPESVDVSPTDESESTVEVTKKPVQDDSTDDKVEIYQVAFVEEEDVLNVRREPGADSRIIGELNNREDDVELLHEEEWVHDSLWIRVKVDEIAGWVNSRYLTAVIDEDRFCRDEEPRQIALALAKLIEERDSESLADLVAEGRGLRIRRHWWNPEVLLSEQDIADIFSSSEEYEWGRADGTGDDIIGSFRTVILPLLDENLLQANESGCNEILHGGTAGFVKLPSSYEGINYYSFFRPPPEDGIEMDWGSWVVGIENWQGEYRLSFLIHYQWEI
jgi:hypothetical protein